MANRYSSALVLTLASALPALSPLKAQVPMQTSSSYTEDFNSLSSSGFNAPWQDNTNLGNWYWQVAGTDPLLYNVGNGFSTTAGRWAFGASLGAERAMGNLNSGAIGDMAIGVLLQNTSPQVITEVTVAYTGEQWRNGGVVDAQTMSFAYRVTATLDPDLQPGQFLDWSPVPSLHFTSLVGSTFSGSLNGNLAANQVVLPAIALPGLSIPQGHYLQLKWDDPDHPGNDHGLAIDDVTIAWTVPVGPPPSLTASLPTLVFGNVEVGTTSPAQFVQLTGTGLAPAPGELNATVDPSAPFTISLDGSTFSTALDIPFASAALPATALYARFAPTEEGPRTGSIMITGGGLAAALLIELSGTGVITIGIPEMNADLVRAWTIPGHIVVEGYVEGGQILRVTDVAGRLMTHRTLLTGQRAELSTAGWPAGVYHVSATGAGGRWAAGVVVE
jgi:hypothetical protein